MKYRDALREQKDLEQKLEQLIGEHRKTKEELDKKSTELFEILGKPKKSSSIQTSNLTFDRVVATELTSGQI